MDSLPVELINKILSFLPLIDRVKCESVNWKFNNVCKGLWRLQSRIDETELPAIKWITEFQTIRPDPSNEARTDSVRWQLTQKCSRIQNIVVDDEKVNSKFFIERVPYIRHLIVRNCSGNFAILNEARSLQAIVFEKSDCSEYEVIQHLPNTIIHIEGPSICDPWVNKWDEFCEHSDCVRFQNLQSLTIVISLQTTTQLNNLIRLDQLTHIRFLMGDDSVTILLIKYLQLRGSKLRGLELFQPDHHPSCRDVYAAVTNNCVLLQQLGMKGHVHGKEDYNQFKNFLFNFTSLTAVSLNITRSLTHDEVVTICENNPNLRKLNYTYYMPSISPQKFKNCKQYCGEVKSFVDNFNRINPGRRRITFDTSQVVKKIISNWL